LVYFLALTNHVEESEFMAIARRFSIVESKADHLVSQRTLARHALTNFARKIETPSQTFHTLLGLDWETLLLTMALTSRENTRRQVAEFITTYRFVKPAIDGNDLIEMGYEPGPQFQEILETIRDAKLDGQLKTADEEKRLIAKLFPLSPQ
jgi:tRNA nucleotidyltransferase (CCA-adding enzyme)